MLRSVIKSATTSNEKRTLTREHANYGIPEIASCPDIRTLHDTISQPDADSQEPPSLVFEWMDFDLRALPAYLFRADQHWPKAVSKAVLSALVCLKSLNAIHAGITISLISIQFTDP
jgi:hypothetical protein